jgi:hypothetical protein
MRFVVDNAALARFSPSTSVFPAKHSTDCSTPIIIHLHPGLVQWASSGLSNSGLGSTPPFTKKRKKVLPDDESFTLLEDGTDKYRQKKYEVLGKINRSLSFGANGLHRKRTQEKYTGGRFHPHKLK